MTHPHRWLIGLIILTACLYAPLRQARWVYEDENWRALAGTAPSTIAIGRSLTIWSFAGTADHPGLAHAVNVGLHLVNGALVYALTAALAGAVPAVIAAEVFLLHPMNSQAVSYLSARTDLLMTFGILIAAWLAVRLGGSATLPRLVLAAAGVVVGLVVAAMSREIGGVGIVLVFLTLLLWRTSSAMRAWCIAIMAIVACAALGSQWERLTMYWSLTNTGVTGDGAGTALGWFAFLLLQNAAAWDLLSQCVTLRGFTIDHDPIAFSAAWTWFSLCLTAIASTTMIVAWRRLPALAWCLAWVACCLAPRFVFRTSEFLSEYHVYAASVAISALAGMGLSAVCRRHPALWWHERLA